MNSMHRLPVDVLWIARYDYSAGWTLQSHQHNYHQMILFLDGKGEFTVEGQPPQIHGGELFLIRAGETHGFRAETLVRTLDVKFRLAPGILAKSLETAARSLPSFGPGAAALLERIRTEGEIKSPLYRELCSVLLTEILYLYLRQDPNGTAQPEGSATAQIAMRDPILQRAIACIRAEYHRPLTVRQIAAVSGCTDRTLRLHFQEVLQTRPLTFLQRHRIDQARALLQYSDYTLKAIAAQVGFQTVHHFTRLFTALEKRSPAAWRKECLEGIRKDVYINPDFENRILTIQE